MWIQSIQDVLYTNLRTTESIIERIKLNANTSSVVSEAISSLDDVVSMFHKQLSLASYKQEQSK